MKIDEIYYLIPSKSLDEELRRVYNDKEVLEMTDIVVANRFINFYALIVPMIDANISIDGASVQETPKRRPNNLGGI